MAREFLDANVLVYAYDPTDQDKHGRAKSLVKTLNNDKRAAVSVQVMQEFYVVATRKIATPMTATDALMRLELLARWRVFAPVPGDVIEAVRLSQESHVSLWDAMIVLAAQRTGSATLWSEDLNDGQKFGAVTVRNPFR